LVAACISVAYVIVVSLVRQREIWYQEIRQDFLVEMVQRTADAVDELDQLRRSPGLTEPERVEQRRKRCLLACQDLIDRCALTMNIAFWPTVIRAITPRSWYTGIASVWYLAPRSDERLGFHIGLVAAPSASRQITAAIHELQRHSCPALYDAAKMEELLNKKTKNGKVNHRGVIDHHDHPTICSLTGYIYHTQKGFFERDVQSVLYFDPTFMDDIPEASITPEVKHYLDFRMVAGTPVSGEEAKFGVLLAFRNTEDLVADDWDVVVTTGRLLGMLIARTASH
jgi:hypothetical protein